MSRVRTRLRAGVLAPALALVLALTTACGGQEEEPVTDYTPLSEAELVAQIEQLPGVEDADVTFSDTFSGGRAYRGEVRLEPGARADPVATLDATYAILRQGEPDAGLGVSVVDPETKRAYNSSALGLTDTASLRARYGPQPGDGTPPAELP